MQSTAASWCSLACFESRFGWISCQRRQRFEALWITSWSIWSWHAWIGCQARAVGIRSGWRPATLSRRCSLERTMLVSKVESSQKCSFNIISPEIRTSKFHSYLMSSNALEPMRISWRILRNESHSHGMHNQYWFQIPIWMSQIFYKYVQITVECSKPLLNPVFRWIQNT